jgi:hypothetical protein
MFNRFKRRPLLVAFFVIQLLLFSSYTYVFYQHDDPSNDASLSSDKPISEDLPASSIENGARMLLRDNYKALKYRQPAKNKNVQSFEQLKSLNVSLVTEGDSQETLIQCSLLPPNLGERDSTR